MELVYGISRWTSASRAGARHIDDGFGEPLCGGNGRKAFTWEKEEGEPTCKQCTAMMKHAYDVKNGNVQRWAMETQQHHGTS